jgi:hypothetical protein
MAHVAAAGLRTLGPEFVDQFESGHERFLSKAGMATPPVSRAVAGTGSAPCGPLSSGTISGSRFALLLGEGSSSCQELRTPQLPMTHVPVGYCGQHRRSCRSHKCMTVTATTSCRTKAVKAQKSWPDGTRGGRPGSSARSRDERRNARPQHDCRTSRHGSFRLRFYQRAKVLAGRNPRRPSRFVGTFQRRAAERTPTA